MVRLQHKAEMLSKRSRKLRRKVQKKWHKAGFIVGYALIGVLIGLFIVRNKAVSETVSMAAPKRTESKMIANPLDQQTAADIAVQVAIATKVEETVGVMERANSVQAELSAVPSDNTAVLSKPQIVKTDIKSKKDIKKYTVQAGDTVSSLASKFGVKSESIRWSNDIAGENLLAGKELWIPPQDGIVYVVKNGDTPDSLASKYRANKEQIIKFNDADEELGGLKVGERIMIPDGSIAAPVVRPSLSFGYVSGFQPVYGYNGYDYGYCTWYVANRRAQIGKPIPANFGNAYTWKIRAASAGYVVGGAPASGAIAWSVYPATWLGHVAFVEEVYPDGSFKLSEMNVVGWGRVSTQIVPAASTNRYQFIY